MTQNCINTYVHAHPVCLSKAMLNESCSKDWKLDLWLHNSDIFLIFLSFHCSESVFGFWGRSFAQAAFSSNFLWFSPTEFCPNSRQMSSPSSYETPCWIKSKWMKQNDCRLCPFSILVNINSTNTGNMERNYVPSFRQLREIQGYVAQE